MRFTLRIALGVLLAVSLALQPAVAADKKDKAAREAQRRMALIKQQMEAEKAELQASFDKQKAELQGKVEQSEKAGNALKGGLAAAKRRNVELTLELETLRKEKTDLDAAKLRTENSLSETRATLESTRKTLAETQRDLKTNEAQRKEISKSLVQRDGSLAACTAKNAKLHDFGLQLVKVYDKPSTYEAVMRTEPFAQTKRVELENILQDYRDKLDEQVVTTNSK
jgi:chromosome segregation ATPase